MSDPRPIDPPESDDEAAWQDLVRRFHESGPVTREPAHPQTGSTAGTDGSREAAGQGGSDDTGDPRDTEGPEDAGHGGDHGGGPDGAAPGQSAPGSSATRDGAAQPEDGRPGRGETGRREFVWRALPGVGPAGSGPRDHVAEETDEDFEPPEPAPLSSAEPALALAWTGVVVSLGLLLTITLFVRSTPSLVAWVLGGLFLVSAGYLGYRLPRERDDGDDGAQV